MGKPWTNSIPDVIKWMLLTKNKRPFIKVGVTPKNISTESLIMTKHHYTLDVFFDEGTYELESNSGNKFVYVFMRTYQPILNGAYKPIIPHLVD
jgi:hypothetical protein